MLSYTGASKPGSLLLYKGGQGSAQFSIPGMIVGRKMTVSMVCDTMGARFKIDGARRGLILGGGCDSTAIYTGRLTASAADGTFAISVERATKWRVAVWES